MKQLKLNLVNWDAVREGHLRAEVESLKKKIDFLNHSRASYIGKFKQLKTK